MNIENIENALLNYFSQRLGLVIDSAVGGIFRGEIPIGVETGVALFIDRELLDNEIHVPRFDLQIIGRFTSRDAAWTLLSKLDDIAPVWGVDIGGYVMKSLLRSGDSAPYNVLEKGIVKYCCSAHFTLSVTES